MKSLYKQLQKEQMKKLKEGNRGGGEEGGVSTERKKFVSNCLVKVSCSEESTITKEQLKVQCVRVCVCCVRVYACLCVSIHHSVLVLITQEHCCTFGRVAYVDFIDGQKEVSQTCSNFTHHSSDLLPTRGM